MGFATSDIKEGAEVMRLQPLSYYDKLLEPKRADYTVEDDGGCRDTRNQPTQCFKTDDEGTILFRYDRLPRGMLPTDIKVYTQEI